LGNGTTQQTQRTFARANLLQTCYGETGVMDLGLCCAVLRCDHRQRSPSKNKLSTTDLWL